MKTPVQTILALTVFGLLVVTPGCSSKESDSKEVNVSKQINALKSADKNARIDAMVQLGSAGKKALPAMPVLIETVKDKDPEIRRLAAYALGEIGPRATPAIAPLKELLKDENREVVTQVVNSLRNIDPKAIDERNVNVLSP